jgi:arabinan endo-1,5-alpha-L-arabinosidase
VITRRQFLSAAGAVPLAGTFLDRRVSASSPASAAAPAQAAETGETVQLGDIRQRDPFILADAASRTYYLVTSLIRPSGHAGTGVAVFTSSDLQNWRGPHPVFDTPADFWGREGLWAPEMHAYQGKYYIFATFTSSEKFPEQWRNWPPRVKRGSQVLVGDSPRGPFRAFHNRAHTPADMMTLDGTFWVEDGIPYMVFCHEWVQITNGTVEMIPLKPDLSDAAGEPVVLFHGSDAHWTRPSKQYGSTVTDGPFLYRTRTGKLLMVWSSFDGNGVYTTGVAVSESGKLRGPWMHQREPLYEIDGGHAMIFRTFDGNLMLVLHQPNRSPKERSRLFELEDTGDTVRIRKG